MILLWFLAGNAVEALNTLTRKWCAGHIRPQRPRWAVTLTLLGFLFRLGCTALVFGLALSQSAKYGLAAFLGYWLFRWVMIRWIQRRIHQRATEKDQEFVPK